MCLESIYDKVNDDLTDNMFYGAISEIYGHMLSL